MGNGLHWIRFSVNYFSRLLSIYLDSFNFVHFTTRRILKLNDAKQNIIQIGLILYVMQTQEKGL